MYDDELTNDELDALDEALASLSPDEISMDVSTMEGFFTALAIGPTTQMPSTWLPWIWDMYEGKAAPDFKSMDEASRVLGLVMCHYNAVIRQFMTDPTGFEPLYYFDVAWGAAEWCEGFLLGMQFDSQSWGLLMLSQPTWFAPFLRLGTDEGMELLMKEPDGELWMDEVVPALLKIHAHWRQQRSAQPGGWVEDEFEMGGEPHGPVVRATPKVGRNDPCPCGSGRKFKKCCGSAEPTLH